MFRIFKYIIPITGKYVDKQVINMPSNATIIHIAPQGSNDWVCVWAIVDPLEPEEPHVIWVIGTGAEMPQTVGMHLATVQMGEYVWHFFEFMGPE